MLVPEALEVLGGVVEELEAARQRLADEISKPPRGRRYALGCIELSEDLQHYAFLITMHFSFSISVPEKGKSAFKCYCGVMFSACLCLTMLLLHN